MKVLILALDGLEHELVVKWKLKYLMQRTYGKLTLSQRYYRKASPIIMQGFKKVTLYSGPYTPIVWASFITGLPPEKHGVKAFTTYGKHLDFLRHLPLIKSLKGKRKIFKRFFKLKVVSKETMNATTIFDLVTPSIAIDVPTYNLRDIKWLNRAMQKGIQGVIKEAWRIYKNRKRRLFRYISTNNWELLMAYFNLADIMGHVHIAKRLRTLQTVYEELNDLARKTKNSLPKDTILLIVSDHGMKPAPDGTGAHSNHAFYSLNFETDWTPRNITDFSSKILEWVGS